MSSGIVKIKGKKKAYVIKLAVWPE